MVQTPGFGGCKWWPGWAGVVWCPHWRAIPTYCQSLWEAAEGSITKPSSACSSHLCSGFGCGGLTTTMKHLAHWQVSSCAISSVPVSDLRHANYIGNTS